MCLALKKTQVLSNVERLKMPQIHMNIHKSINIQNPKLVTSGDIHSALPLPQLP
jgi:hypothetical protein